MFDIVYPSFVFSDNPKSGAIKYAYEIYKRAYKEYDCFLISGHTDILKQKPKNHIQIKLTKNLALDFLYFSLEVRRILRKINFKLVHSFFMETFLPKNLNSIITVYHIGHLIGKFKTSSQLISKPLFYLIKKNLENSKKIIAISNETKKDLINIGIPENKIDVIYLGIDKRFFVKKKKKKDKITILNVSAILPQKGQHLLLKTIKNLDKNLLDNIEIEIVGFPRDARYLEYLYKISKGLPVKFFLNVKDTLKFYKNADIFVFPSIMREGFGLVVLEAMASRNVILSFPQPTIKEICKDAAIYFNNIDELKERLELLLENKKLIKKYKNLAFKKAKDFSWERTWKKHKKIYEELL